MKKPVCLDMENKMIKSEGPIHRGTGEVFLVAGDRDSGVYIDGGRFFIGRVRFIFWKHWLQCGEE